MRRSQPPKAASASRHPNGESSLHVVGLTRDLLGDPTRSWDAMIRVQIQLPEDIHLRATRLAAAKEISLAELARRGLELVLAQTPAPERMESPWRPPTVRGLGWKALTHAEIKEAAQKAGTEEELEERARTASRV